MEYWLCMQHKILITIKKTAVRERKRDCQMRWRDGGTEKQRVRYQNHPDLHEEVKKMCPVFLIFLFIFHFPLLSLITLVWFVSLYSFQLCIMSFVTYNFCLYMRFSLYFSFYLFISLFLSFLACRLFSLSLSVLLFVLFLIRFLQNSAWFIPKFPHFCGGQKCVWCVILASYLSTGFVSFLIFFSQWRRQNKFRLPKEILIST